MIDSSLHEDVLTLRLNHGKAQVMDLELLSALSDALDERPEVRAIVLTGTGSIFSAGVDLRRILQGGEAYVREFLPLLDAVFSKLFGTPIPVIAAVNGHAIAGGCVLLQACDLRILARSSARLGVPELLVGVPLPYAALEILRFQLPAGPLQALLYSGATVTADRALELSLVDELCPAEELSYRAHTMARTCAQMTSAAVQLTKASLRRESIERIQNLGPDYNETALQQWFAPHTFAKIAAYLERTLGAARS